MSLDKTYFDQMEAKIPHGRVRTRFAPSPTGYMHVATCARRCIPGSLPGPTAGISSSASRTRTRAAMWTARWT